MGLAADGVRKGEYPNSKADLFAMFIERASDWRCPMGLSAMITMQSWMFLDSFHRLRSNLLQTTPLVSMAHLGARRIDTIRRGCFYDRLPRGARVEGRRLAGTSSACR